LKSELEADRPGSQTPVGTHPGLKKVADGTVTCPSNPRGTHDPGNGGAKARARVKR